MAAVQFTRTGYLSHETSSSYASIGSHIYEEPINFRQVSPSSDGFDEIPMVNTVQIPDENFQISTINDLKRDTISLPKTLVDVNQSSHIGKNKKGNEAIVRISDENSQNSSTNPFKRDTDILTRNRSVTKHENLEKNVVPIPSARDEQPSITPGESTGISNNFNSTNPFCGDSGFLPTNRTDSHTINGKNCDSHKDLRLNQVFQTTVGGKPSPSITPGKANAISENYNVKNPLYGDSKFLPINCAATNMMYERNGGLEEYVDNSTIITLPSSDNDPLSDNNLESDNNESWDGTNEILISDNPLYGDPGFLPHRVRTATNRAYENDVNEANSDNKIADTCPGQCQSNFINS